MREAERFWMDRMETPIGELLIVADETGALRTVEWMDYERRIGQSLQMQCGPERRLEAKPDPFGLTSALQAYFAGKLDAICELPVGCTGTDFQRSVWAALRKIPCGTTVSYGALAERLGRPNAMRAVGLANGANPVGVVVPCHRVIGADGSMTGYGGGVERKRWLLAHEGAIDATLFGEEASLFYKTAGAKA